MSQTTDNHRRIAFVMNSLTGEELKAGKRDVSRVYSLLLNPMYGACDKNSPEPIYECNSKTMFYDLFNKTINELKIGDQLIFYFSGHGIEVNDEYCLKVGLNKNDLFSFHSLISELKINSLQKAIIIIDACYSGAVKGVKAPIDTLPFKNKDEIPKGIAVIVSCRDTELSHELNDSSYSVFTDLLCQGIETGLDGKTTDNNLIYIEDIVEYVNHKIVNDEIYLGINQHAQYFSEGFERKIWLSYNKTRINTLLDKNNKLDEKHIELLRRIANEELEKITKPNIGEDSLVNIKSIDEDQIISKIIERFELREKELRKITARGLRSLSEADIDEILGRHILKIVDNNLRFIDLIERVKNTINQYIAFGGKGDDAKRFFDGFSFSIYYYNVISQEGSYSLPDKLLPIELRESDLNYISKFKSIIEKLELNFKKYNNIKRNIYEIIDNEEPLDICCFVRIIDSKRAYFILSHEPSNFFKEQIDDILLKRYKNNYDMQKNLEELSKNYIIPKVEIAIFNSNGLDLPSDDGKSLFVSKTGERDFSVQQEEELLIILDDMQKKFDKKSSFFNKRKDYFGNQNTWYYWATSYKKYLAVKMFEPLSDKDREKFCSYVEKNIWNNLIKTKSLSEMQDWLDIFIPRDAGFLANKPIIVGRIRAVYNGLLSLSVLLIFMIIGIYYQQPSLLLPDLRHEVLKSEDELNRFKSKVDITNKFQSKLGNISNKLLVQLEIADDCFEPFKFSYRKIMIDDLVQDDQVRLRRIANNLILLQKEIKITILKYNNIDENLNSERANNIRAFLIKEGVPEISVTISDEIEKMMLSGVRLKLML